MYSAYLFLGPPEVVTVNSVLHALCRGSHHVAAQRLLGGTKTIRDEMG